MDSIQHIVLIVVVLIFYQRITHFVVMDIAFGLFNISSKFLLYIVCCLLFPLPPQESK
jgi:hypothetical protein